MRKPYDHLSGCALARLQQQRPKQNWMATSLSQSEASMMSEGVLGDEALQEFKLKKAINPTSR